VLTSLAASGAENVALVLEIIPPFEEDDDRVIDDIAVSAELWRDALQRHRAAGSLS
jgi:hypothetical protein